MVQQTNLVRPRTASTLPKNPIVSERSNSLTLTLIAIIIFLFCFCCVLIIGIVFIGKSLSFNDKPHINIKDTVNHNKLVVNSEPYDGINFNKKSEVKFRILNTIPTSEFDVSKMSGNKTIKIVSTIIDKLTYRLPVEVKPVLYKLQLHPDLVKKTFSGNVSIHLKVTKPVPFIAVHTKFLDITETKLFKKNPNEETLLSDVSIKQTFEYSPFEYWVSEFEDTLEVGDYILGLQFNGSLVNKLVGLYQSNYFDKTTNRSRLS